MPHNNTNLLFEANKLSLKNSVQNNHHKVWLPPLSVYNYNYTNSCHNRSYIPNPIPNAFPPFDFKSLKSTKTDREKKKLIQSRRIFLLPTRRQKSILHLWFNACTDMYNVTIKYIKSHFNPKRLKYIRSIDSKIKTIKKTIDNITKLNKKIEAQKKVLFRYISTKRKRSSKNIQTYNTKMSEYMNVKAQIKSNNITLNDFKNELTKLSTKRKQIHNKIEHIQLNYKYLRTYALKDKRNAIMNKYIHANNESTQIKAHIIDCVIKFACASFKTAVTNFIDGHIKKFRIRPLKHDRKKKVMEIETSFVKNGIICNDPLGKIKMKFCTRGKLIDYDLRPTKAIKIHYDSENNIYSIFEPLNAKAINTENVQESSFIGLDPGIRTFMTGLSNSEAIKFDLVSRNIIQGDKFVNLIEDELKKIDKINATEIDQHTKNKRNRKHYRRISNIVDEMHWKVINYLVKNYKKIYIGKLNIQEIISKDGVLTEMTKRIGQYLKHYQFRQRLENKCKIAKTICVVVDERFTSKTCSNCGNYKGDLGGNKEYNCRNCRKLIDRDINGCRCILLKNMSIENDL